MAFERFTKENHRVHPSQAVTYHVPMSRISEFEMKTFGRETYLYGELICKLGKYEDLGKPEDIARKLGIKTSWTK